MDFGRRVQNVLLWLSQQFFVPLAALFLGEPLSDLTGTGFAFPIATMGIALITGYCLARELPVLQPSGKLVGIVPGVLWIGVFAYELTQSWEFAQELISFEAGGGFGVILFSVPVLACVSYSIGAWASGRGFRPPLRTG